MFAHAPAGAHLEVRRSAAFTVELFGQFLLKLQGKTCDAIEGILSEGEEILEEFKGTSALDAGLLAAAQAVEHYEISRYGTLRTWATELGLKDVA